MISVFYILFNLATQIKWISSTGELTLKNSAYINNIKFEDEFFNKLTYAKSISGIAQDFLIIKTCAFLDEFEKELTPRKFPEYASQIIELKRITKPAFKKIKSWKNLKEFRNQIIAHNNRINGVSIFENQNKIDYVIPSTNREYILLADLIFLIALNIKTVFPEIVDNMDFSLSLLNKMKIHSKKIDTQKEYEIIENEVKRLIKTAPNTRS